MGTLPTCVAEEPGKLFPLEEGTTSFCAFEVTLYGKVGHPRPQLVYNTYVAYIHVVDDSWSYYVSYCLNVSNGAHKASFYEPLF